MSGVPYLSSRLAAHLRVLRESARPQVTLRQRAPQVSFSASPPTIRPDLTSNARICPDIVAE